MPTIAEQLTSLSNTKTAIKDAIVAKGVSVADTDPFRSYADKIGQISGGGESDTVPDWEPNPNWWDIKSVIDSDTRDYPGKAILLFYNFSDTSTFVSNQNNRLRAVATSDGAFYEFNVPSLTVASVYTDTITHTWDATKDKDDGAGRKTRWVMYYFDNLFRTSSSSYYARYITFNGGGDIEFGLDNNCIAYAIVRHFIDGDRFFSYNPLLECIDYDGEIVRYSSENTQPGYSEAFLKKCASLQKIICSEIQLWGAANNLFSECVSLKKIPSGLLNFDHCTSCQGIFNGCESLQEVPDDLFVMSSGELFKPTLFNSAFMNCVSLRKLPRFDTSSATNITYFGAGCFRLKEINQTIDVSSCTTYPNYCFQGTLLEEVPYVGLDRIVPTQVNNLYYQMSNLKTVPTISITRTNVNLSGVIRDCPKVEELTIDIVAPTRGASQLFADMESLVRVNGVLDLSQTTTTFAASTAPFRNCYNLQDVKIILPSKNFWLINDKLNPESYNFIADNAPDVTASPVTLHVGQFKLAQLQNNALFAGVLDKLTAKGWVVAV